MSISGHIASTVDALLERMDAAMDFLFFPKDKPRFGEDEVEVNGVVLPRLVADQLRRQGIALSNYSGAELKAAVRACAYDSKLIDDDHGINFFDRLELTDHENAQQTSEAETAQRRISFRERIIEEREKKCQAGEENKGAEMMGCGA